MLGNTCKSAKFSSMCSFFFFIVCFSDLDTPLMCILVCFCDQQREFLYKMNILQLKFQKSSPRFRQEYFNRNTSTKPKKYAGSEYLKQLMKTKIVKISQKFMEWDCLTITRKTLLKNHQKIELNFKSNIIGTIYMVHISSLRNDETWCMFQIRNYFSTSKSKINGP